MSTIEGETAYSLKNNQLIKKIDDSEVLYIENPQSKDKIKIGEAQNILTIYELNKIIKEEK
ncbi:MAG: hypothetical protein R3E90_11730 [Marinicella sp.]